MWKAAFAAVGLDWRYHKLPVPPSLFRETALALPGSGYRGANVTIPHKRAALALADTATEVARAVGAANTLSFDEGEVAADNTDAGGFLAALGEPPRGRALVLGAGGAARAVVWALHAAGADEVLVWNRTADAARELARDLGATAVARPAAADLLVNATSVGLDTGLDEAAALAALRLDRLDVPAVVADVVYRGGGGETPVAAWGRRGGAKVVGGLEMLVQQGALSFERWTGTRAPLDVMRSAAAA